MRPLNNTDSFGRRLRYRRWELGITQTELANKVKISDNMISRYERDEAVPDTDLANRLAKALSTTVKSLRAATVNKDVELERLFRLLEKIPHRELNIIKKTITNEIRLYFLATGKGDFFR